MSDALLVIGGLAGVFCVTTGFYLAIFLPICLHHRGVDEYNEPFRPISQEDASGPCNGNAPPWESATGSHQRRNLATSSYTSIANHDKEAIEKDVNKALVSSEVTLPEGFLAVTKDDMAFIGYHVPSSNAIASKAAADWNFDQEAFRKQLDSFDARYDSYCLSHIDDSVASQPAHKFNVIMDDFITLMNNTVNSMPEEMRMKQNTFPIAKYEDLIARAGLLATSAIATTAAAASALPTIGMSS